MENAKVKLLPGTSTYIAQEEKGFSRIEMMISATGGLNLSQVCAVTGLEGTTIQNWVKRGWVEHPKEKKYGEAHIARILIINALKECIKLEHITMLTGYVSSLTENGNDGVIKERELFNCLCDSLHMISETDDLSRTGIETVAEKVIREYEGRAPGELDKIRKALIVMIYACVCTDVKRRTESMMNQVLREIEVSQVKSTSVKSRDSTDETATATPAVKPPRKTVSQAIREWDLKNVESSATEEIAPEQSIESETPQEQSDSAGEPRDDSAVTKPVYFGRG